MTSRKQSLVVVGVVLLGFLVGSVGWAAELELSFNEVEFAQIYRALGESAGLNVLVDPSVQGQGTFQLKGVTVLEAVDLISRVNGYQYHLEGNTLLVGTPAKLEALDGKEVRYIEVQSIQVDEVLNALTLIMPRSDVYVQPQSGLVILYGTTEILDQAEKMINALDGSVFEQHTKDESSSLLEIFKDLTAEMNLNLVADPALENTRLHLNVRNQNPEELIKQIQVLVPLKIEKTENTLVVGSLTDSNAERVKVYRLDYAEPEATLSALTTIISEENLRMDEDRKSVIVRGTDLELAKIDLFMVDFDQPLPQVVLEVWVQEMSSDALRDLGVEWRGVPSFSGGDAPVFFELAWEPWELILALRVLEEQGEAKLLANPRISTLSGQEARIFVGDRVPVILTNEDGSSNVNFIESGINLKVTPRISDDEYITILVQPEVSTFIWRADTEYPQIRTREAETTVRVKDGQPFVLGGLLQEQETELISRIPFLSQLPILGQLFQWRETQRSQTEMTIFLIPRIIDGDQGVVDHGFFTLAQ